MADKKLIATTVSSREKGKKDVKRERLRVVKGRFQHRETKMNARRTT